MAVVRGCLSTTGELKLELEELELEELDDETKFSSDGKCGQGP